MAYVRRSMCLIWKWMVKSSFLFPSSRLQLDGGLDLLNGNTNNTAVMSSISQVYFIFSSFGEQGLTSICKYNPQCVYCHCDFIQHMCIINGPGTIRIQLQTTRCQCTRISSSASWSRVIQQYKSGFVTLGKIPAQDNENICERCLAKKNVGNTFNETNIHKHFYRLPHKAIKICYK